MDSISLIVALEMIEHADSFQTPELQRQTQIITAGTNTTFYRVLCNGCESALVALDRRSDIDRLVLYELFVPRHLRRKGVGSAVLGEIERVALFEGFYAVRLTAEPRDTDISLPVLVEWYRERGYQVDASVPNEMEKRVRLGEYEGK